MPDPQETPGPAPTTRAFSLRLRLLLVGILVVVISLGLVGIALDQAYQRRAETAQRDRMESYVYLVLAAIEVSAAGRLELQGDLGDPRLSQPASGVVVHVHGTEDHWTSPSGLGVERPELPPLEAGQSRYDRPDDPGGLYTYSYGVLWQLADGTELPFTVSVLVDADALRRERDAFRSGLWRSLGAAGLILAAAQLLLLTLVMRPLNRVARDVARVEQGATRRLEGRYPRELEPLTRNVNRLLASEQANRNRYRNALDSLAHSLKTPLAVVRSALRRDDAAARDEAQQAIDDMQHLVATRLQRAAASTRRTLVPPVPVRPQAERVLASLEKVHSQKMITAECNIDPDTHFYGEQRDLLELLGNLLDNAFKYGRRRVRLDAAPIGATGERPGLRVVVEDDGPGIPAEQAGRLLQRGMRGDEREDGHGFGLAIVAELVDAYEGRLDIDRGPWGGARISVELPPA